METPHIRLLPRVEIRFPDSSRNKACPNLNVFGPTSLYSVLLHVVKLNFLFLQRNFMLYEHRKEIFSNAKS